MSFNVSAVKDQGNCGSCWTFSTIGTLEAHANIVTDTRTDKDRHHWSEQQVLECARSEFDNDGCRGGLPSHAFEYIKYAGGVSTLEDYPYTAVDDYDHCEWEYNVDSDFHWKGSYVTVTGSHNITENDEEEA